MESNSSRLEQLQIRSLQLPVQFRALLDHCHATSPLIGIVALLALGAFVVLPGLWTRKKKPPGLFDPIPFVFNTIQFIFDNDRFLNRVSEALDHVHLVRFYLFQTPVFLISGQQNIQTLFSRSHKVNSEAMFVEHAFPNLYRMPKEDVQRFACDKSGRDRVPAPGSEHVALEGRYWFGYDHVHSEYLSKTQHFRPVADYFSKCMASALDETYAVGDWSPVSLIDFCREQVAGRAIEALFGPRIFELNPGLLDAFWKFDSNIFVLTLGLPKWLFPGAYRAQERYYSMIRRYLDATQGVDSPAADTNLDRHPGALACGEIVKWFRDNKFDDRAAVGSMAMLMFGLISNTVPITMWTVLEIAKDAALLQAIREEVATACMADPATGAETLDVGKVAALPLLQSVFTEALRLHMNFNLMRNVREPIVVDGVTLRAGSMLQAPMRVAHYDEAAWGRAGHPAADFWAERHVAYRNQQRVFAMAGRPSSYFPFGGGHQICPGRHMAKHEIMTTVALLVSKFDIELVGWTKLDGSPSQRAAQNDRRFSGAGGMPPDRDLKMRWKRNQRRLVISG